MTPLTRREIASVNEHTYLKVISGEPKQTLLDYKSRTHLN